MKKLAIIFGAKSYEHEISIVSAISMKKVLENELIYIFIDENRDFYNLPSDKITSKLISSGEYKKFDKLNIVQEGFEKPSMFGSKKIEFDTVLNLVHGHDGENGVLSSMLEFFNIPFIGPRNEACLVSFDKFITKNYASTSKVKTLGCAYFSKDKINEIVIKQYPVIIKPTKLGSSIGVSIVKNEEELSYALDTAFEFDNTIIVEQFIENVKEYNLAGVKINNEFSFSTIEEPHKNEYLDFQKKYLDFSRTEQIQKADISDELAAKLKQSFINLYGDTFDGSLIRCDFFVINNEVYLNEINSIPGSMANYLFDDFNGIINKLANNLPKFKDISITYEYVNKINSAKGK